MKLSRIRKWQACQSTNSEKYRETSITFHISQIMLQIRTLTVHFSMSTLVIVTLTCIHFTESLNIEGGLGISLFANLCALISRRLKKNFPHRTFRGVRNISWNVRKFVLFLLLIDMII